MTDRDDDISRHAAELARLTRVAFDGGHDGRDLPEDEVARLGMLIATERQLLIDAVGALLAADEGEAVGPGVAEFDASSSPSTTARPPATTASAASSTRSGAMPLRLRVATTVGRGEPLTPSRGINSMNERPSDDPHLSHDDACTGAGVPQFGHSPLDIVFVLLARQPRGARP